VLSIVRGGMDAEHLVCSLGALVCWIKYLQGEFEQALELVAQVRGSGGYGATIGAIEALALTQAGATAASLKRIEAIAFDFPQSQTLQGALGYAYATSKQTGSALEILQNLEQSNAGKKPNNAYARALVLLGLGDARETAPWLEGCVCRRVALESWIPLRPRPAAPP